MSTTPTALRSPTSQHSSPSHVPRRAPTGARGLQPASRAAPYMVALSGWPEPVYIDRQGVGVVRSARSRSGTPRGSISGPSGEAAKTKQQTEPAVAQGVAEKGIMGVKMGQTSMLPPGGMEWSDHKDGGSGHFTPPVPPAVGPTITEALYPYLHSNTRPKSSLPSRTPTPSNTPPPQKPYTFPGNPSIPPLVLSKPTTSDPPSQPPSHSSNKASSSSSHRVTFADPRFTPHASVIGRHGGHLRVVPSWNNSVPVSASRVLLNTYDHSPAYSSIRTQHPSDRAADKDRETPFPPSAEGGRTRSMGVGGRVLQLGSIQGRTQPVILRSTPEVYPVRQSSTGNAAGTRNNWMGADLAVGLATEVYPRDPESLHLWPGIEGGREGARVAEGAGTGGADTPNQLLSRRNPTSALSPEGGGGWSPTVPWQDEDGADKGRDDGEGETEGNDKMLVD